jgi:hypothetical protein
MLYALHLSLKTQMNHTGGVTEVTFRDYSHWLHDYELPQRDTCWRDRLFEIRAEADSDAGPYPAT